MKIKGVPFYGLSFMAALLIGAVTTPASAQTTQVTINAKAHRSVGGVGELDRARYFGFHGTLTPGGWATDLMVSETDLNTSPTRSSEIGGIMSAGLPEDPTRPGFFDPTALQNHILNSHNAYINDTRSWSRWRTIQEAPNPVLVDYARAQNFIVPQFLRTVPAGEPNAGYVHNSMIMNHAAYAEFLKIYLSNVQFPASLSPERFYIEIVNEPEGRFDSVFDVQRMIDLHKDVITDVKASFPNQKMGGPSLWTGDFSGSGFAKWNNEFKPFIDQAGSVVDFYTFHPYDRYTVKSNGTWFRDIPMGPGIVSANLDMIEAYSANTLGTVKPFAFTEYGSWNRTEMSNGSYGSYTRTQQQWDLSRDIREKLFVFLDRPDRIVTATPFVSPKHWQSGIPTPAEGDNVFWEQDASGVWHETIIASMYRMFSNVKGHYIDADASSPDLQLQAYRNGNEVYVLLNNLRSTTQNLNLQGLAGSLGNVVSASLDKIEMLGGTPTFTDDLDVTGVWQNLSLTGEAGAVLTLTLSGPQLYDIAYDERTFYASDTTVNLNASGSTPFMALIADTTDAVSATMRIGYQRFGAPEAFTVSINGNIINVPAGTLALDDGDWNLVSREVDVPLAYLNPTGINILQIDFVGGGGTVSSAALVVTRTVGDLNNSGVFDPDDVSLLAAQFGPASAGSRYDLNADGMVDELDVEYLVQTLRGTILSDLNLDGFIGIEDLNLILGKWNQSVNAHDLAAGDITGDGFVGIEDLNAVLGNWNTGTPPSAADVIPEPGTAALLSLAMAGLTRRRR